MKIYLKIFISKYQKKEDEDTGGGGGLYKDRNTSYKYTIMETHKWSTNGFRKILAHGKYQQGILTFT
jgi:hypothetical protein